MGGLDAGYGRARQDVWHRTRRTRETATLRRMVRETRLSVDNLVYPMFIVEGNGDKQEIPSMPGQYQIPIGRLVEECREVVDLGIPAIILFGIPSKKDDRASEAYNENGVIQCGVHAVKSAFPDLCVITDVCLCEYMDHGHCGLVHEGRILNDPTLELLERTAVSHVRAGADMVAPSDMMDGRVGAIRRALDAAGFTQAPIMAYSAKFASSFYGPFRVAAESAPAFGDRSSYQMDPANGKEALREIEFDLDEGADIIMVKPALPYLDILARARERVECPLAAYNVSGEYAMLVAASRNRWIDPERAFMEVLISIKRAGADIVLTYFSKDAARRLAGDLRTPLCWMN